MDISNYNWIWWLVICNFRCFFTYVLLLLLLLFFFFLLFGARDYRRMIFSESSPVSLSFTAGHQLGTLSIGIYNSLIVYDNLWALKFGNFSEFQNVIGDTPSIITTHCVRKSICDSPIIINYMYKEFVIRIEDCPSWHLVVQSQQWKTRTDVRLFFCFGSNCLEGFLELHVLCRQNHIER